MIAVIILSFAWYISMLINVSNHCAVGILGYPDEWDSKKYETIYNIQCIGYVVLAFILLPITIIKGY